MRTPNFWYNKSGQLSLIFLLPSFIYILAITIYRILSKPYCSNIPVVCIGNITAGGTGKTPATIAITERLKGMGLKPQIVSRGYRGSEKGPLLVDNKSHSVNQVGDEPLLLSNYAPTWVSKKKVLGVKAAIQAGADIIILDDGFQNMSVHKDLSIVIADASLGFGNERIIPAGPLREKFTSGIKRADILISIGSTISQKKFSEKYDLLISKKHHVKAKIIPLNTGMNWDKLRVLAFAGIGNPDKFFHTLQNLGAKIVLEKKLADHQKFDIKMLTRLESEALAANAQLVTTEKDAVRLPINFIKKILILPVRLEIDDWGLLDEALKMIIPKN